MNHRMITTSALMMAGVALSPLAIAAVAKVDLAFVAKVSQGGSFEVLASQLAVNRATSADVKAFAQKDVDDHTKVNDELKSIAVTQSLPLKSDLDSALQKKLDRLGRLTGPAFDAAYISEMKSIHHKDEGIFAKEAKNAANPDWKAFATKTDEIVKSHIVALDANR